MIAVLILWKPDPHTLVPDRSSGGTVAVVARDEDDSRPVDLDIESGPTVRVLSPVSGTVTESSCRAGVVVPSGAPIARVNGRAVVGLSTGVPLWRDITVGLTGSDVVGLRRELGRLRLLISTESSAADATLIRTANRVAQTGQGVVLAKNAFAWLPSPSTTPTTCDAPVGTVTQPASPLLTARPRVTAIRVSGLPPDALPGDRNLVLGSVEVPAPKEAVTDPAAIARLVATREYAQFVATDGKLPLRGDWRLASPTRVAVLPPSTIIVSGNTTCVAVGGKGRVVTIVSSSLGRSVVTFAAPWPDRVDADPDRTLTCG
jgi:pyruvate/2-oxoglutarate dehydrogenase complex dihydrolipoamide acyltransferase (E2) component